MEPSENRESGVIPERNRHCKRGGRTFDESRSLGQPEKALCRLMRRKSGDLLEFIMECPAASGVDSGIFFACRNTAAAVLQSLQPIFYVFF